MDGPNSLPVNFSFFRESHVKVTLTAASDAEEGVKPLLRNSWFHIWPSREHEKVETNDISNHVEDLPFGQAMAKLFDRLGVTCADLPHDEAELTLQSDDKSWEFA